MSNNFNSIFLMILIDHCLKKKLIRIKNKIKQTKKKSTFIENKVSRVVEYRQVISETLIKLKQNSREQAVLFAKGTYRNVIQTRNRVLNNNEKEKNKTGTLPV